MEYKNIEIQQCETGSKGNGISNQQGKDGLDHINVGITDYPSGKTKYN